MPFYLHFLSECFHVKKKKKYVQYDIRAIHIMTLICVLYIFIQCILVELSKYRCIICSEIRVAMKPVKQLRKHTKLSHCQRSGYYKVLCEQHICEVDIIITVVTRQIGVFNFRDEDSTVRIATRESC